MGDLVKKEKSKKEREGKNKYAEQLKKEAQAVENELLKEKKRAIGKRKAKEDHDRKETERLKKLKDAKPDKGKQTPVFEHPKKEKDPYKNGLLKEAQEEEAKREKVRLQSRGATKASLRVKRDEQKKENINKG